MVHEKRNVVIQCRNKRTQFLQCEGFGNFISVTLLIPVDLWSVTFELESFKPYLKLILAHFIVMVEIKSFGRWFSTACIYWKLCSLGKRLSVAGEHDSSKMATNCSSESQLNVKIEEWLKWDKNPETAAAIRKLAEENNLDELSKKLLHRLSFGKFAYSSASCT